MYVKLFVFVNVILGYSIAFLKTNVLFMIMIKSSCVIPNNILIPREGARV